MSVHVLLNLLNTLRKRDEMRGLSSILSFLHIEFDQFNNTGGTYFRLYLSHDNKITSTSHYGVENVKILPCYAALLYTSQCNVNLRIESYFSAFH